jgi:hypothetical protein
MDDVDRGGGVATVTAPEDAGAAPQGGAGRRRIIVVAAVAAVVLVAAAVFVVAQLAGDGGSSAEPTQGPPLELALGANDVMASCLPLDAAILADMAPAFAATATSVDGQTVTLDVDRWYAGGDAGSVVLHAPAGMQALIDGFDFEVGAQYLITATDGSVNYCGYSGPATPELAAVYAAAFPA